MSTVYRHNSSRRFPEVPQDEMQKKWDADLGTPTGAVCGICGQKSSDGKIVNGKCRKCRNDPLCGCPEGLRKSIEEETDK
jgi:hypothetical protein